MYSVYGQYLIKYVPIEIVEQIYINICDIIIIDINNNYISFINPYTNIILKNIKKNINININNILIHEQFIYSFYYKLNYYNLLEDNKSNDYKHLAINKIYNIIESLKNDKNTIMYAFSPDLKHYININGHIQNCLIEIKETDTNKRICSRYFNIDYIFIFEDFGSNIIWNNNRIIFSVYRIMSASSKLFIFDTNLNLIEDYNLSHRAIILNYSNNILVSIDEHENKGSIIKNNFIKNLYFDKMNIISCIIAPNNKQLIINDNNNYKLYDLF